MSTDGEGRTQIRVLIQQIFGRYPDVPRKPRMKYRMGKKADGEDKLGAVLFGEEARASSNIFLRRKEDATDHGHSHGRSFNHSGCDVHPRQRLQPRSPLTPHIKLHSQGPKAIVRDLKTFHT